MWSSDLGKVKCNWESRVSSCSSEKQSVQDTERVFSVLVSTVSGLLLSPLLGPRAQLHLSTVQPRLGPRLPG